MPLPQVNDRLKEVPAQALRTVFATIGQLLLVADRLRARAAEQLTGSGEATAAPPPQKAPATPPPAPRARRTAPAPDAESTRWRSLDKTGNVRLLDGDEDQDEEDLAVPATPAARQRSGSGFSVPEPAASEPAAPGPAAPGPAAPGPAAPAVPDPVPAPVEYTPTEPVPAGPPPAGLAPAGEALPVPNYDQLTVASLRARLRVLDPAQVQLLLDYEKAHEGRPAVITMFERRLTKLSEGS